MTAMHSSATTLGERLEQRGVSRRAFLQWCGVMAATLALPASYRPQIAEALQKARPIVIWREFQDCAGNSEALLRSPHPSISELVLELLSLEYHELLMGGAGHQAEARSDEIVERFKGEYIAVIEGAIPMGADGAYCTIGGRAAKDIARQVCTNAKVNIAIGACAWDGGFVGLGPTGAVGLQDAVPEAPNVINFGGCPANPANTAAVITHYLTFGELPALDRYNRPLFAYGDLIHDQCERRAYYDAGLFAERWGDEGHRKGYCLYKLGCKGPAATYNCPNVRWNDGTSWPVQAGHGCIACASPHFWSDMSPFYERLPDVPGFGADTTAEKIGLTVVGAVAGASAVHASLKIARARRATREPTGAGEDAGGPQEPPHGAPSGDRPDDE